MGDGIGIRRYDYVEFYVGSARPWAYWMAKALGLAVTAYAGPETGVRDRASYLLEKNKLRFLVTAPLASGSAEIADFVRRHGDGVKRWALEVEDVRAAFERALAHGAIEARPPRRSEAAEGVYEEAALKLYDDTELVFTRRDRFRGPFKPGYGAPRQDIRIEAHDTGLVAVDHIVGNVRRNEMDAWAGYFQRALGFESFIEFGAGDIGTRYSALLSKVVRSPNGAVRNPINEPYPGARKSQIEEFLEHYDGSGVQHVAILTGDILSTVRAMRRNGVEFLDVPATYYDALAARRDLRIEERVEDLRELGILCDAEGEGYLLQLFTKPIGDRPTFFFEVIQRKRGAQGFGKGNFQALFEAIERDQAARGNL